jgi:hypothetical protein
VSILEVYRHRFPPLSLLPNLIRQYTHPIFCLDSSRLPQIVVMNPITQPKEDSQWELMLRITHPPQDTGRLSFRFLSAISDPPIIQVYV